MKRAALALLVLVTLNFANAQESTTASKNEGNLPALYWAYAVDPPSTEKSKPAANQKHQVPGSNAVFTSAQISDLFHPPDWHPQDHPPMPPVVANGRPPEVYACGYCHLPNGQGRPENANVAGLPAAYIAQQMADFKSGARKGSEPRHLPSNYMAGVAKAANDEDVRASAEYFSQLTPHPWVRVIEKGKVPKTHVAGWMLVVTTPVSTEAIGQRIIEIPVDLELTELRDDRSSFIAYVPPGSIKSGRRLAESGQNGKTLSCSLCHGRDLRGHDNAPALAGRSPSYIVRQLNDMQNGNRHGAAADQMKPVVQKLAVKDMIALAAYCASLRP
jgi:cytochrome c553